MKISRYQTKNMFSRLFGIIVLAAGMMVGCGSNDVVTDTTGTDTVVADTAGTDTIVTDTTVTDTTVTDTVVTDTAVTDTNATDQIQGDTANPWDFDIRMPDQEAKECVTEFVGTSMMPQADFICQIDNTAMNAMLYIQSNPESCDGFGTPAYSTPGAWLKTGDQIAEITGSYDAGGKHRNDYITFNVGDTKFIIGHSSIGWGWRVCSPPDCLIVCENGVDCTADGVTGIQQNGCTRAAGGPPPALQVICVQVNADGTVPEMLDPWTTPSPWVEGDDVFILPCGGEDQFM
jgi:hypothetical protein